VFSDFLNCSNLLTHELVPCFCTRRTNYGGDSEVFSVCLNRGAVGCYIVLCVVCNCVICVVDDGSYSIWEA